MALFLLITYIVILIFQIILFVISIRKKVNSNPRIPFVTQDSLFVNENPVL